MDKNDSASVRHSMATTLEARDKSGKFTLSVGISIYTLAILPIMLGFTYVGFGVLYTNYLRVAAFELTWLVFAFVLIGTSVISKAPVIEEVKNLSRSYFAVFALFTCIWVYTSAVIAPGKIMTNYASATGVAAILSGLAITALKRRFGNIIISGVSWALFVAMLLHAPLWMWLYALEGQNPDFNWLGRLPGYPSLRMYGYSVEAGLAAGLGLYFLSHCKDTLKRAFLAVGTTLLWMLLFWSGGRGGLLGLFASVFFAALFIPKFTVKMWRFLGSTIMIGAGLSLLLPIPSSAYGLLGGIKRTLNSGSLNDISSNRLSLWSDAYNIFLDRPIFGHGISQYQYLTEQADLANHIQVHNIVLESLISFGLVGTFALIFLLGKIWITAAIRLRNGYSLSTLPVFLIATSMLVHGLLSGTYYHIHSVLIIAISLGLLLYDHSESPVDLSGLVRI